MEQNGEDEEGILGFLPKDIKKEVFRGNRLVRARLSVPQRNFCLEQRLMCNYAIELCVLPSSWCYDWMHRQNM